MTNFNVSLNLPSGKSILVNELTNKQYLVILKFCENADLKGLNAFFNTLFDSSYKTLNIVDKFYTLLAYRMLFIDPEIGFKFDNNQITLSIADILHKIDQSTRDYTFKCRIDGIDIELDLPNVIHFTSIDDLFTGVITSLTLNNKQIAFSDLDEKSKSDILSMMPTSCFNAIRNYIDTISKQLQSFIILEENKEFNVQEIKIDIISNGFLAFISNIYSTGLQNFLELLYHSSTKLNISSDTFFSLTPLDVRVLFNIYNRDVEQRNKDVETLKTAYPE